MVNLFEDWCAKYPIISIEDGCAEKDWDGWKIMSLRLNNKVQLVGDDLFVTTTAILQQQRGCELKKALGEQAQLASLTCWK